MGTIPASAKREESPANNNPLLKARLAEKAKLLD